MVLQGYLSFQPVNGGDLILAHPLEYPASLQFKQFARYVKSRILYAAWEKLQPADLEKKKTLLLHSFLLEL